MMKKCILVPSAIIELTGEIQACLSLAKRQGFDISDVELGVCPAQHVELVSTGKDSESKSLCLTTDLISLDADAATIPQFRLNYAPIALTDLALSESADIYLNVSDEKNKLDVWRHPLTNEVRALQRTPSDHTQQNHRHLAWLVTLLALDFPIEDALTLARAMLGVSRETWAFDFCSFPTPLLEDHRLGITLGWSKGESNDPLRFPTVTKSSLGLYPVVDDVSWVEQLLPMGINTIQLRIKDTQQADLEQQVIRAIELGERYKAQVFINDYWQLAVKHGAFGVHLGQEDIDESNLEALARANIRLGLSTHGYYELLRIIQINPSYIALGHIFPTTTKQMPSLPQGLVRLKLYQQLINTIPYGDNVGLPSVAIGGIDLSNADRVWQCGVSSLAVVRAITQSDEPRSVITSFGDIMLGNPESNRAIGECYSQVEGA